MKFSKNIALLLSIVFLSACSGTLDVAPTSIITNDSFWKTEDDAKGALAAVYVKLRSEALLNLFLLGEARSESMETEGIVADTYGSYRKNILDANTYPAPSWLGLYAVINAANQILSHVPSINFALEEDKNSTLAQAYATRAYVYFVLVRTWGGVPLRTEPTEGYAPEKTFKERATETEVFQLIKADLENALALLSTDGFTAGRNTWSRPSVNALKGEVFLWTAKRMNGGQADFTIALEACNQAQNADVSLLNDFASIFDYGNKGNKEILMAVRCQQFESANNYFQNMYLPTHAIPGNMDQASKDKLGVLGGNIILSPSKVLRDQFEAGDSRKEGSYVEVFDNKPTGPAYFASIVLKGKGVVSGGVRYFADDLILYRYADVLLMKAEAKNALGLDPSEEINLIRKRAFGSTYDAHVFKSGSKERNDEVILQERLLELAFEGKRWWDVVRFDKAFDLVPALAAQKGSDYLLLFPIPSTVLSLEPLVKQNPGYN